jgi:hypothetical protein
MIAYIPITCANIASSTTGLLKNDSIGSRQLTTIRYFTKWSSKWVGSHIRVEGKSRRPCARFRRPFFEQSFVPLGIRRLEEAH